MSAGMDAGHVVWRAAIAIVGAAALSGAAALAKPAELEIAPSVEIEPPADAAPVPEVSPDEAEIFFDEAAWRALVEGKTLYYETAEGLVGREYYLPGTNRAVFEYAADGSCFEGSWTEREGVFCFDYDGTHCFFHLKRGGEIFARQMDGVDQRVVKITQEKLACSDGLTS